MDNLQIVFTAVNTAELVSVPYRTPAAHEVVVETVFSTISSGTEKANITGDPSVAGNSGITVGFPRKLGYSSTGIVREVGEAVGRVNVGDRVIVFWGTHSRFNTVPESNVIRITDTSIGLSEAALVFISTFPLAAIRKTQLDIGESSVVMGLGLLGQLAVRLLRAAGAAPIIAVDPVEERRQEALASGADYAFDPTEADYSVRIKQITGGGANVAIEVTGVGAGLDGVLDCMAKFGRVALLGCTRDKEFTIDYYKKVHSPGITLIGAHTNARPARESHHGMLTHEDDIRAVLKLIALGRLGFADMVREIHTPIDCPAVYQRLIHDRNFPIVVQFDWRNIQ